jgi:hypothetical protein
LRRSCKQVLQGQAALDLVAAYACRLRCGCSARFGWPEDMEAELTDWTARSHAATLAQPPALDALAAQFEGIVTRMLDERRTSGAGPSRM